jgi:hypothetical protein
MQAAAGGVVTDTLTCYCRREFADIEAWHRHRGIHGGCMRNLGESLGLKKDASGVWRAIDRPQKKRRRGVGARS